MDRHSNSDKETGEKLGAAIEYTDPSTGIKYVFEVPVYLQNEKDIAPAVNHGFTADGKPIISFRADGKNRFVFDVSDETLIGVIEAFPRHDGWYLAEGKFGIPAGDGSIPSNSDARYLSRIDDYVGLLARGYYGRILDGYYVRCGVDAYWLPSGRFGALGASAGAQAPAAPKNATAVAVEAAKSDLNALAADAVAAVAKITDEAIAQPIRNLIAAVANQ